MKKANHAKRGSLFLEEAHGLDAIFFIFSYAIYSNVLQSQIFLLFNTKNKSEFNSKF